MKSRNSLLRKEKIGAGWVLTLRVSPTGRFILHLRWLGRPTLTRSKFFSSAAIAEDTFFQWRDEKIRQLMAAELTGSENWDD